jgi:hypothetical protein
MSDSPIDKTDLIKVGLKILANLNTAQKVCLLIFITFIVIFLVAGAITPSYYYSFELGKKLYNANPWFEEWYQIASLGLLIGGVVGIFLFKD